MTRLRLRTLSSMVKFNRSKKLGPTTLGACHGTNRGAVAHPFESGDVPGVLEGIDYNENTYQEIRELCAQDSAPREEKVYYIRQAYFKFAVTLVHEVAYAVAAVMAGISNQYVFDDSTMAEDGFDWERRAFGDQWSLVRGKVAMWASQSENGLAHRLASP